MQVILSTIFTKSGPFAVYTTAPLYQGLGRGRWAYRIAVLRDSRGNDHPLYVEFGIA